MFFLDCFLFWCGFLHFCFLLAAFRFGFLPCDFVFCLQLSACCFLFFACCLLLSLSYLSCFLLLAVSLLLSVSCCLRSPERYLLSISASWFSVNALSFPIAAICDFCFCFLLLSFCSVLAAGDDSSSFSAPSLFNLTHICPCSSWVFMVLE